jgi:eukaryotic-like serine/threonine-protein kinase
MSFGDGIEFFQRVEQRTGIEMDSLRWQRIQELFHQASDLPGPQRRAFLESFSGTDQELVSEVLGMLEQDAKGGSLLDHRLADVAHQTLSGTDPLPTKEFGPYRVLGVLGEGGMGVVYLAERTDLGNQVAIKVLRDAWLSPSRRERFASEQRTLAQLNHPSIAQLYDADTLPDGTPWFVMERVEGVPLTEYCREHNSSLQERLQLFRSVCEAVEYAHSSAVIHRDLKPSNILVKSDGTIRLLDFGIAKQLESLDVPVDQTMTGLRLMTPAYAAPEQIRGARVGIHTDVYSLGVILFELLTGQLPFDLSNLTPVEAATVITEHEPGKPSAVAKRPGKTNPIALSKTAWADLDVLCLTAMHKDPQRRYRSVEALIRDVDHYLKGEPLEARADTLPYRMGKFVRRHHRAVTAAALVSVVVIGMVVFFTVRLAKARNAALAEAARTQRVQQFMMNLFNGGDEAVGPAADMKVLTMVDRGVQQAQALSTDPKVQAELYETLGSIYQKLGKLDRAESLLRQSLEMRKTLFGADSAEVAESLVALGDLADDQARPDDAESLARQGLEMAKRHLPPNHPAVAKATATLGGIVEDRGHYDQAIELLNEAVRLQSASGIDTPDLAASLSELANAHFYAGHYEISDSLNRRVLEMHRRLYGERHPLVADTLINLGEIQVQGGHYEQAEQFDRQALDITESWYGKNHPETASDMTILGRVLVYEKHYDEAATLLQQALAVQERVYGPMHPRVASALNDLGKVAQSRGQLDEAEADFRRMAEIYRSVYQDHHYLIAVALSNLGSVYLEKKQYARAEQLFREVIQRFTDTLSADHLNTGIARMKLGKALLLERRYAEAEQETLAGYQILAKQPAPNMGLLVKARQDLVEEYDALNQPDKAAKVRAELAAPEKPAPTEVKN